MLQSELLRRGELAWLTRNTFFGTERNYLETDIDDTFLFDDTWSIGGTATTGAHSTDYNPADALRGSRRTPPAPVQALARRTHRPTRRAASDGPGRS